MTLAKQSEAMTGRLWTDFRYSLRDPGYWAFSSWLDILVRSRRSRLGLFWLMAPALVYVYGIGAFFAGIQDRPIGPFAVHVALGAMVFRTLMSTIISSASIFQQSEAFILDGNVRLTDYLLQSLAKSFFDLCTYVPIVVVALLMYDGVHLLGLLLAPFTIILVYVNALWVSVVFGLIGARYTDVAQLLGNISVFFFLLTPIIWEASTMPAGSGRGFMMRANPFFHFVEIFRAPFLGEKIELSSFIYVGVFTVLGLMIATLLYRRYSRFVPLWI